MQVAHTPEPKLFQALFNLWKHLKTINFKCVKKHMNELVILVFLWNRTNLVRTEESNILKTTVADAGKSINSDVSA